MITPGPHLYDCQCPDCKAAWREVFERVQTNSERDVMTAETTGEFHVEPSDEVKR